MYCQKNSTLPCKLFAFSFMFSCALGMRLRANDATAVSVSALHSRDEWKKEWSVKNIVGLVGIILVVASILLSFVYVGKIRKRTTRLSVLKIILSDATPQSPITAVMKVNSIEKPLHLNIPVETKSGTTRLDEKNVFEIDSNKFDDASFSLIIREGNLPIHFETLRGKQFMKANNQSGQKEKRLEIGKLQEGNSKIEIVFTIYSPM